MKSIRVKLWSAMMALVVIMLVLLWLFQVVFLEDFYTNIRIKEIKKNSYAIMEEFENTNDNNIKDKLDFFTYKNNLSIEILDSSGNDLYKSSGINNPYPKMMRNNKMQDKIFNNILSGEEMKISQTHHRFGNEIIILGLPLELPNQTKGVFYVNIPLAPVADTALILKKQLVYITIILLLVTLILSFIISRSFLKPIFQIKKAAEKMAAGNFSHRIKSTSKDEIGQLAGTINYMGEELAKTDKLRKELIANTSHELRTPLTLIQGYAETIRDVTGDTPSKRDKHLNIIIEESQRLSTMVDDILNLSQLQAGYLDLNLQETPLNTFITQIINKYELLSKKTGISITTNCSSDIIALIDPAKMEQVFTNLINNAFRHTSEGGNISIIATKKDNLTRIEIKDTGEGIPEDDLNNIWDRYYKSANTDKNKMSGTGLGLSIVKNILEAHHASFGVYSKKDIGTSFWFELNNKIN